MKKTSTKPTAKAAKSAKATKAAKALKSAKAIAAAVPSKPTATSRITAAGLSGWNKWLAALYLVQALAVLLIGTAKLLPVSLTYLTDDPLSGEVAGHPVVASAVRHMGDLNLAQLLAASLTATALIHILLAGWYAHRYEDGLRRGMNIWHWVEQGVSSSLLLVAVAMIAGVSDLLTLLMIVAFQAGLHLTGLLTERAAKKHDTRPNRLAVLIAAGAGLMPWLIIFTYIAAALTYGSHGLQGIAFWIIGVMFVTSVLQALNAWLQRVRKGRWGDFLFGESAYLILNLTTRTLIIWLIFAGMLRP